MHMLSCSIKDDSLDLGGGDGLVKVSKEILDALNTDGETKHLGRTTGTGLLLRVELGMGGGGWVNDEGLGVSDVGDVGEELEGLDTLLTLLDATLDADDDHGATLAVEVLLVELIALVILEARVPHPCHAWVLLEMLGAGESVAAVTLHAKRESLDALKEHPGIVRRHTSTQIAERHGPHTEDEGEGRQSLREVVSPTEATIGGIRRVVERVLPTLPVEAARVTDNATNADTVATGPFGERVADEIDVIIERFHNPWRGEGIVHKDRKALSVSHSHHGVHVGHLEP
mgnify:CR=1 FL=1